MIELNDDFRDLLVALHDAGARFVVVGGYAVAFHGHVTCVARTSRRMTACFSSASLRAASTSSTGADGISFEEAVADGQTFELEGRAIPVIGLEALLKNTQAAGRADIKALQREPSR